MLAPGRGHSRAAVCMAGWAGHVPGLSPLGKPATHQMARTPPRPAGVLTDLTLNTYITQSPFLEAIKNQSTADLLTSWPFHLSEKQILQSTHLLSIVCFPQCFFLKTVMFNLMKWLFRMCHIQEVSLVPPSNFMCIFYNYIFEQSQLYFNPRSTSNNSDFVPNYFFHHFQLPKTDAQTPPVFIWLT